MQKSSNQSKVFHRSLHFDAHSTIDSWQSKTAQLKRTKSVPSLPEPLHIHAQSRIDTWQKRRARSISTIPSVITNKPVHVVSRSKIDTWSNAPIRRQHSLSTQQPTQIKTEAKPRVDTWQTVNNQHRRHTIQVNTLTLMLF